jgi:uncharacterized protein YndB with AHSA1/START domain
MNIPIELVYSYNASIDRVWNALTDPELMRQWYFETIESFEAREGFETQFNVKAPSRDFLHIWQITEVIKPELLVHTWSYKDIIGHATVSFKLKEIAKRTQLELKLVGLETFPTDIPEFTRASCVAGWNYFLGQNLSAFLNEGQ